MPIALFHAGSANSPVIEGSAEAHRSQAQGCDPTTDVIAVPWAGRVPYATGRPTLDMLGLNDTHIAHLPSLQRGIDVKMDPEYVLARRPKLIFVNVNHCYVQKECSFADAGWLEDWRPAAHRTAASVA